MNPESLCRCSRHDEGAIPFDVYTQPCSAGQMPGPSSSYSQRWWLSQKKQHFEGEVKGCPRKTDQPQGQHLKGGSVQPSN